MTPTQEHPSFGMHGTSSQEAAGGGTPSAKRRMWETRYRERKLSEFHWYLDEPPPELQEFMAGEPLEKGAALDLGCGPGVVTAFLAGRFLPSIGVDIAHPALVQAKEVARERGASPSYLVAEAPIIPFRSQSFVLVFDRGCLQAIPRSAWPDYFQEVDRVLKPGGVLHLYVSRPMKGGGLTARRLKNAARRVLGRTRQQVSGEAFRHLLPPTMEMVLTKRFTKRAGGGRIRVWVYGLFRKS